MVLAEASGLEDSIEVSHTPHIESITREIGRADTLPVLMLVWGGGDEEEEEEEEKDGVAVVVVVVEEDCNEAMGCCALIVSVIARAS